MKQLSYAITVALTILGLILAQNVVPAFAQQDIFGGKHLINDVNHYQNLASNAAIKNLNNLQAIIKYADTLIANRLSSLNELSNRIQSDSSLSTNEKNSLTTEIQTDSNGLTALKAKIDADTDVTTAQNDAKTIITNYYIYLMFEPKIRLLITINDLQNVTANVQSLVPQLQNLINTFKAQGKDVTQLQALLDDISSQLQTVNTTLTKDATAVEGISVSSKDTAQSTFMQVRQDLAQVVKVDFPKIRSDFEQMRPLFEQIIFPGKTPTASSSGTTSSKCFQRPSCLDGTPRCMIMEPKQGWCHTAPTPSVTSSVTSVTITSPEAKEQ